MSRGHRALASLLAFLVLVAASKVAGQTQSQSPSQHTLSLGECLRIAEEKHPDLAASRDLIRAAEQHLRVTRAAFQPQVNLGLSYTRQTYNFAATPGTTPHQVELFTNPQTSATANYYFAGPTLSQTVYDFGRTRGAVERSGADLETARENFFRTRDLIDLNVRVAYFGVLAAEELVRIGADSVANQSRHLDQIKAFYAVGTRPKIDVTNQEVALARAQVDLRQSQENLQVARAALATAMGIPIGQSPEPANILKTEEETQDLPQLLAYARQHRPDIQALREQVRGAQADIKAARGNLRPDFSFTSFFDYRNLKFPLIYNWGLAGTVAQNLFSGGAFRALVAQTQAQEGAVQSNLDSLLNQVDQQVYTAYADLQVAKDKIGLALEAEAAARENLRLAEGRYAAGYGNIIELTDAELLSTTSQSQVITSRYDYHTAAARLDAATGRRVAIK